MSRTGRWVWTVVIGVPLAAFVIWAVANNTKLFVATTLNGLTLAALYFLVASGFTLVFGLMRNVNLAHGSLYLLGAYIGYSVGEASGSWFLGACGRLPVDRAGRPAAAGPRSSATWRGRICGRRWSPSACRSCWPT